MASGSSRRLQHGLQQPWPLNQERQDFLKELRHFLQSKGAGFTRLPTVRGREIDLFQLYKTVSLLGGWEKVGHNDRWEDLAEEYNFPNGCANSSQALKYIYLRYLSLYEKSKKGSDVPAEYEDEVQSTPGQKRAKDPTMLVPMQYKYQQHVVSDHIRETLDMNKDFVEQGEYDRIEKALLCGLPNEVDFAFNVCTLLANEGKHRLRLNHCVKLVDLLMAHVGLFREGSGNLFQLAELGWKPSKKKKVPTATLR